MTTEDFIKKAREIHGDKYDYSKVEYIDTKTKVCIVCPEHGEFWITPHNHIQKRGCKSCGDIAKSKSWESVDKKVLRRKLFTTFVKNAKVKHGDKYDYSNVEYVNSRTKVCIVCPEHGEFWMTPRQHLQGCGCYGCGKEEFSNKRKLGSEGFIEKAKQIHGDKYDYSKVEYIDSLTKVCIICPEHGEFWQTPSAHLYLREGCPKCNESHLEKLTRIYLENNDIKFISECSRDTFLWLGLQTLDFYLPELDLAIECQGRQHFSDKAFSGKEKKRDFEYQIKNDILKGEKCSANGLRLLYFVDNLSYALNSGIPIYNRNNTFDNLENITNG